MTVEPISRLVVDNVKDIRGEEEYDISGPTHKRASTESKSAMDSAEDIRRQEEVECAISRLVGNSSKDMAIVRLVPREEEEEALSRQNPSWWWAGTRTFVPRGTLPGWMGQ